MARAIQTNLSAGEISRQAAARFDLALRAAAAEALENVFVMIEGGATRTPGAIHVASPKFSTKRARLIAFKKSSEDVVVIEAGENYLRYFDAFTRQALLDGVGALIETATTYTLTRLDNLYWFQSADVMWFTVKTGESKPRILVRFSDIDWQLSTYDAKQGPFLPESQDEIAMTATAATGNITVTTASPVFEAGHVGGRFRLWTANAGVPYEQWKAEEAVTVGVRRVYDGNVYLCTAAGTTSRQPPVHQKGAVTDGGVVAWTFEHDLAGIFRVTVFNNASSVSAAVESQLPEGLVSTVWAEGFFSDARGWPFVGGLFQSRLFYAGAPQFPDTLFMTRTDGFGPTFADFKQSAGGGEIVDDDAVVRTLNDGEVNRIAWAIVGEQILLGHSGGIVRISGPSLQEPITPSGASAIKPDAPPGAFFRCRAIKANDRIVYASTSGRRLIALNPQDFSFRTLTALTRDKGSARFIELAYASEPFNRLFALREDGRLFACAFDQEQGVIGWSSIVPAGNLAGAAPTIDSIAVAPDQNGRDRLWMMVARTVNGATKRSIEIMDADYDSGERLPDDALFADAAVRVDLWNADAAKTVAVTHAGGAVAAVRDASVTLTAAGFVFAGGDVGKEIRLRRLHAPRLAADVDGEVAATITAQAGATATATLLTDVPAGLYGAALDQWAFAASSISGLAHLNGETVGVRADGVDLGDFAVAGGAVALGGTYARALAGLRKSWKIRSLDFVLQLRDGVSKGQVLQAKRAYVDMIDTAAEEVSVSMLVNGRASGAEKMAPRDDDDLMSIGPGLRSGAFRQSLAAGKARRLQIDLSGSGTGPATILSLGVEYEP